MKREPLLKQKDSFGLLECLNVYLKDRPDAIAFLQAYRDYCHSIDDIIDIPERRNDNEFILSVFNKAHDLYSSQFYREHWTELYSVVKIIHNTYADSVKIEFAEKAEDWQKNLSDVIRNTANEMIHTVVRIVVGETTGNIESAYNAMRNVSLRAKYQSWQDHHNEKGEPL